MAEADETDLQRTQILRLPGTPADAAARAAARLPVLVVMRGAQVGRRYLLNEDALVVGRRGDRSQLVIDGDQQVSGVHCRIERAAGVDAWRLVDLGSTNGTLLRGARISNELLRDGERIQIGETVLKFTYHDELEEDFHRQVDHLMNRDELTGLPVQRVYRQRLQETLWHCVRASKPLAVLMLDLDGLKKINDTHGHLLGARAIATVGRRLGAIVQAQQGVVSRFGGDEFSAFVPGLDRAGALALGEQLGESVRGEPIVDGSISVRPTISIGVAAFPADGTTVEALTRRADAALYRAKAAGRDCVRD